MKKWKNENENDKENDKNMKNEDEKMLKNDQRHDKRNDNQNDKKWKKYFKDFQCVAGSFFFIMTRHSHMDKSTRRQRGMKESRREETRR